MSPYFVCIRHWTRSRAFKNDKTCFLPQKSLQSIEKGVWRQTKVPELNFNMELYIKCINKRCTHVKCLEDSANSGERYISPENHSTSRNMPDIQMGKWFRQWEHPALKWGGASVLLTQPGWDGEMGGLKEQGAGKYEAGELAGARSWKALQAWQMS